MQQQFYAFDTFCCGLQLINKSKELELQSIGQKVANGMESRGRKRVYATKSKKYIEITSSRIKTKSLVLDPNNNAKQNSYMTFSQSNLGNTSVTTDIYFTKNERDSNKNNNIFPNPSRIQNKVLTPIQKLTELVLQQRIKQIPFNTIKGKNFVKEIKMSTRILDSRIRYHQTRENKMFCLK